MNLKKTFRCLLCNKSYLSSLYHFQRHIASHVRPGVALYPDNIRKHGCELCGLTFKTKGKLKNHQVIKHFREVKRFQCNLCSKSFHLISYLTKHKKNHLGLKPCVCKVCGLSYTQPGNLKAHMRNHTGDMFSCDLCAKSYTEKRALVKHKRIVHHVYDKV